MSKKKTYKPKTQNKPQLKTSPKTKKSTATQKTTKKTVKKRDTKSTKTFRVTKTIPNPSPLPKSEPTKEIKTTPITVKQNIFKDFFQSLKAKPTRLILFIIFLLTFLSIPSRLIFQFPDFQPGPPIIRKINVTHPTPLPYPVNTTGVPAPNTTARSVMIVDVPSKAIIYMKNPDQRLYPASTTKMVTALVAMDNYDLNKVASLSSVPKEGQVMGLYQGENIKYKDLLKGLLIYSANDAAEALASLHPKGRDYFITEMNQKVLDLGLTDTHFENPTGFDHYNHYSSVHDLAIIGAKVVENPTLLEFTSTKEATVSDVTGEIVHSLSSTNELLGVVEGMKGLKTGWTEYAGECLVTYTERNGQKIITAVLGSQDRFSETQQLIEWTFANHQWQDISK